MRFLRTTIKVVLAVAMTLPLAPAWAQFSRWAPVMHVDHALNGPVIVSPDGSTLILTRDQPDALLSRDAGVTWTSFTIGGQPVLRTEYGVQVAPTNAKTWYAIGGTDGALYMSTDAGQSWSKRSDAYPSQFAAVNLVSISADPQTLYRAKLQKDPNCPFNEGCPVTQSTWEVSSDGGVNWRTLRTVQGSFSICPSPVDPALLFGVGADGLSRSRDAGATWTVIVPPGSPTSGVIAFDRFDAGIVYLTPSSIDNTHGFVSRDAGTTWSPMTVPAGRLVPDPVQKGRAFLFAFFDGAYETRDTGATWAHVEPSVNTSINYPVGGVVMRDGKRFAVNVWDSDLRQLDLNNGALALTSDLWWNPAQSGWGMSITHHSSTETFVAWFAYNRNGDPVWRVIPGGTWTDRVFAGDVYETSGPPYFGVPFDPAKIMVNRVGTAKISFDDENNATFNWQLNDGLSGTQGIVREEFGVPALGQDIVGDGNFADLWWNAAESGWGIAINHQYNNIFAAWYAYDASGQPLWVVMPDAKMRLEGGVPKASGNLYRTRGPLATAPFDPSLVTSQQVGTATLTFTSSSGAHLDYTAFGVTESRGITRQPF